MLRQTQHRQVESKQQTRKNLIGAGRITQMQRVYCDSDQNKAAIGWESMRWEPMALCCIVYVRVLQRVCAFCLAEHR